MTAGYELLDVTLRDGGYVNGHSWTETQAVDVVRIVADAGIAACEIGYLRSVCDDDRPAACCPPGYLDQLSRAAPGLELAVMVRVGEASPKDLRRLAGSGVRLVRVLVPWDEPGTALGFMGAVRAAGLSVAANLIRASEHSAEALAYAGRLCGSAGAETVYLADSNGSMTMAEVSDKVGRLRDEFDGEIGFHAHDNLGQAFVNSEAALAAGATRIDASIAGLGKGGGNLRLDLIAAAAVVRAGRGYCIDALTGAHIRWLEDLRRQTSSPALAGLCGLLDLNLDGAGFFSDIASTAGFDAAIQQHLASRPGDSAPSATLVAGGGINA